MESSGHPYQWLSLVPPLLVIVLAVVTRKVFASLLAGIFAGALILCNWNPIAATGDFVTVHLWPALIDPDRMSVFIFTLIMGAMIGVINCSAGMRGLVEVMQQFARNRRGGQFTTWLLGLFVFFDDYANTMLLGTTMRKLCDKLKITREKLAFLVDSTAAPVAGLALISTWVAGEIDYVQGGLDKLNLDQDAPSALSIFIDSIPYRFYVLWMLIFVALVALTGRDFGSMYNAEKRGPKIDEDADAIDASTSTDPDPKTASRWHNAVVPILVNVGAIVWFMYSTGVNSTDRTSLREIFGAADPYNSLLWGSLVGYVFSLIWIGAQRIVPWKKMMKSSANGALHMVPALGILWLASCLSNMTKESEGPDAASEKEMATLIVESSLSPADGSLVPEKLEQMLANHQPDPMWIVHAIDQNELTNGKVSVEQLKNVFKAAQVDDEAVYSDGALNEIDNWALTENGVIVGSNKYVNKDHRLYTGDVLASSLGKATPAWLVPTLVFVLAGVIAFATGTSWGTMGILMPLFLPLTVSIMTESGVTNDDLSSLSHPLFLCSVGGVLAGAIFGDHCSPISDTTVLSSQASGCNHLAHVWTQLPYALTIGGLAILAGTLPLGIISSFPALTGFGQVMIWIQLPIGIALMLAILLIFGKCPEENGDNEQKK